MLIQILITIFALFAIISLIRTKKFLWLFFWLIAGIIVWIPNATNTAAQFLGVGRGADLVFYASILILFYILFRIYLRLEKMERDITKVVRKNSLDKTGEE